MYYVAFYTDCERELSQVTRGSLLTLVYNLRRVTTPPAASGGRSSRAAAAAAASTAMSDEDIRAWAMEDAGFFSPGSARGDVGSSSDGGGGTGAPAPAADGGGPIGLAGIGDSPWANVGFGVWGAIGGMGHVTIPRRYLAVHV